MVKELTDGQIQRWTGVFEEIMATVRVAEHLGTGKILPPFIQEVQVKDEVLLTPCQQAGLFV